MTDAIADARNEARDAAERDLLKRLKRTLLEVLSPVLVSRVMDKVEAPIREREQAANDNAAPPDPEEVARVERIRAMADRDVRRG